jgi:hypothetical protein
MPNYEKVLKQPQPNKLRPKTDFSGTEIVDESTNYERYENGPGVPGNSMWTNVNKFRKKNAIVGTDGHPAVKK